MTELVQVKDTMSSLDIAELTGKLHKNVMRDIRDLLEQGVARLNFELGTYSDANGQKRPCYNLTPKGVLILASGYDAVLREKIINRLEELETARRKTEEPALPDNRTERTLARMRNSHSRTFADRDREVAELCRKLYGSGRQPSVKTETTKPSAKPETVKAVTEQTDKASHNHRPDYVRALDGLVFVKYGVPVTSTVAIARLCGVLHNTVLTGVRATLERMPELKSDVTPSYYIARASIKGGCAKQKRPMYLLTRRAFECYLQRTKRLKPDTLRPVFDAFSQTEARIAARPASVEQPQPQPQQTAAEVPAVVPPVQTQGDMAERMIAAMAVLTGADIKKVSEIMRKGGAL